MLRERITIWKQESFGRVEEKKAQILHDIQCIDLKEETVGINEEGWQQRIYLQEEFHRKVHEEEIKWKH